MPFGEPFSSKLLRIELRIKSIRSKEVRDKAVRFATLAAMLGCIPETPHFMPFVDISSLRVVERLPGWYGRYFHSPSMTFAHYDFVRGSSIHEHFHPQEEVYEVIEGELEVTVDGVAQIVKAGVVAIVPSGIRHAVKALTDGRAIIVDHPVRREF